MTSSSKPTVCLDVSENNNNDENKTININNNNNPSCETNNETDKDDVFVEHQNDKLEKKVLPKEEEIDSKVENDNEESVEEKTQASAEVTNTVAEEESSKTSIDRQPTDASEKADEKVVRQVVEKTFKKVTAKRRSFSKTSATSSDLDSNRKDSSSGEFKFLPDGKNKLKLMDSNYGPGVIKQKPTKHLDSSSSKLSTTFHAGVDFPAARFVTSCSHSRKKTNQSLECRNEAAHFMSCKCHLQRVNGRSKSCWQKLVPCSESAKLAHSSMERTESGEDDGEGDDDDDDDERNEDEEGRTGHDQQQYVVNVHVNPGETFSVCVSDQVQLIQGEFLMLLLRLYFLYVAPCVRNAFG